MSWELATEWTQAFSSPSHDGWILFPITKRIWVSIHPPILHENPQNNQAHCWAGGKRCSDSLSCQSWSLESVVIDS